MYYEWEFNLKEIGDLLAVSESRASQLLDQAVSSQRQRIQAADASEEERERQRIEQKKVSREIQTRFGLCEKTERIMEKIRKKNGPRMVTDQGQEISEILLQSFAVTAF